MKKDEYEDAWRDSSMKEWIHHVLDEMVPKMERSGLVISLVPHGKSEGDVKYWVELGASIMMDKPILAVIVGDDPIPFKLQQVADEIVRLPEGVNMEASEELASAIKRMMGEE